MRMSKRTMLRMAILLLMATGLIMLFFPSISQLKYEYKAQKIIENYAKTSRARLANVYASTDGNGNQFDPLYEMVAEHNRMLFETKQKGLTDPFSYQEVDPFLAELGFADDMAGFISIPKMNIELPIYLGANKENLKKGAAHLTHTSLPIGGENTNAVFAAHRGMSTAAMFRDIERLAIGDEVILANLWETMTYQVAETRVIDPTDIDAILIQEGRDLVTLISCHPYRHNYQRYVVYCERRENGVNSNES